MRPGLWSSIKSLVEIGVVLLASWSKNCQKSKNRQKVQKTSKVWNICNNYQFKRTFTKAPILRQLDMKNSSFLYNSLTVFMSSFCWAQELSQYQFWINYQQGKLSGAADVLSHFFSSGAKAEYSSLLPALTNGPSTPNFVCKTHVFPLLLQLWDIPQALWHQDDLRTCCTCLSASHFLNSRYAFRKRTSKPRIRAEIFDVWEDIKEMLYR